jgi:ribosomal protein L19
MDLVDKVEQKYMDRKIPEFRSGDTVRVNVKITEGEKSRIQVFEGVVIAIKRNGLSSKVGGLDAQSSTICESSRVKRLGSKNEGGSL